MILFVLLACRPTDEPPDGDVLLLVETGRSQLTLIDREDATVRGTQCLHELAPDRCRPTRNSKIAECLPFGVDYAWDGELETLQLTWARRDEDVSPGLPAHVTGFVPGHPPESIWEIEDLGYDTHLPEYREGACVEGDGWSADCQLNMTHVTVPSPDGQTLVMADTLSSRVVWVVPGDPPQALAVLDESHPDWDGFLYANNVQMFEEDGRTWLLTTFKSGAFPEVAPRNTGRITLWDVTDLQEPTLAWSYPPEGFLAAVHHGRLIERGGERYIVYAHSLGASDSYEGENGSVGLARFDLDGPIYLGDGVLPDHELGFVREVELSPDSDTLYVVDSGCENPDIEACERAGQLFEVAFPEWADAEVSGAFSADHEQQVFHELELLADDWGVSFSYPFDVDVLLEPDLGPAFASDFGACGE